jgi:hypothetical protein
MVDVAINPLSLSRDTGPIVSSPNFVAPIAKIGSDSRRDKKLKGGRKTWQCALRRQRSVLINAGSSRCWCCGAPQSEEYDHSHARLHRNRKILGENFRETSRRATRSARANDDSRSTLAVEFSH